VPTLSPEKTDGPRSSGKCPFTQLNSSGATSHTPAPKWGLANRVGGLLASVSGGYANSASRFLASVSSGQNALRL
jgi:hypothetical protein